ncbi:MAG: hypothetical protein KC940_09085 [Candidatus Omnitrophica bacterium]|nr:hypothetical protein [Candidatus Omnitrophota bacterium]
MWSKTTRLFLSIAVIVTILSGYVIFAGSTDSSAEFAPGVLNGRLRQLGVDLTDYYRNYREFPVSLDEIQNSFGRYPGDYWDIYSKDREQPIGYKVVREGSAETCLLYTARLKKPIGVVEVVSGTAEFRTTKEYESLRGNELSYESRGLRVWSEASAGEKMLYYILFPYRFLEYRFMQNY